MKDAIERGNCCGIGVFEPKLNTVAFFEAVPIAQEFLEMDKSRASSSRGPKPNHRGRGVAAKATAKTKAKAKVKPKARAKAKAKAKAKSKTQRPAEGSTRGAQGKAKPGSQLSLWHGARLRPPQQHLQVEAIASQNRLL